MIYKIRIILLVLLILSAVLCDIKTYKISNKIIIFFVSSSIVINIMFNGLKGLGESITGIVLPFFVLLILYAGRMLGAGDIKLFSSIGAIMGWHYVLFCIAFSFLAGGVIALVIMLTGKNFTTRIKYFISYMKCCFLTASFLPYSDFVNKNDGAKMRFSYAVAAGTFAYELYMFFNSKI